MEPAIREFFRRISLSLGLGIIWMAINITVGIKLGLGFFEGPIRWYNIVFYVWLAGSLCGLLYLLVRIWKHPIENLDK